MGSSPVLIVSMLFVLCVFILLLFSYFSHATRSNRAGAANYVGCICCMYVLKPMITITSKNVHLSYKIYKTNNCKTVFEQSRSNRDQILITFATFQTRIRLSRIVEVSSFV